MKIPFTKMTGIGNDYIYLDAIQNDLPFERIVKIIPKISQRRFGIGSDGLIFISKSSVADAKMEMFNADGSRSEMCGNGLRCVMQYCLDHIVRKEEISIETDAGITLGKKLKNGQICAELFFPPQVSSYQEHVTVGSRTFDFTRVEVGNPHAVIEFKNIEGVPLQDWGPVIENNRELFPYRVNAEFFEEISPGHVKMRVWERGSGETLACGTGAAAVAAVYRKQNDLNIIKVSLLGGDLTFEWKAKKFYMTGPATYVAEGFFELEPWESK